MQYNFFSVGGNHKTVNLCGCALNKSLLSSSPSLNLFWLMMVSMAMAVFLHTSRFTECSGKTPAQTRPHPPSLANRVQLALPCLPVSDDQLSLTSANGHQTVHSLDPSLHGVLHRDPWDDAWGLDPHSLALVSHYRTLRRESTVRDT